jgi:hypothetical protein
MLNLLAYMRKNPLDKLSALGTKRILDQLQKLEPRDTSSLISEGLFKNLEFMLLEEKSILSQSLHMFPFIPFRNYWWK